MITPGGEVSFVQRIIADSLVLPPTAIATNTLFSSLLGKYSSLAPVVATLHAGGIGNYTIKVLERGWTKRWVVVWTRSDRRLPDELREKAREAGVAPGLLPPPNQREYVCAAGAKFEAVQECLRALWAEAGVESDGGAGDEPSTTTTTAASKRWHIAARSNTWSRAARRARARSTPSIATTTTAAGQSVPLLECTVHLTLAGPASSATTDSGAAVRTGEADDGGYADGLKRKRGDTTDADASADRQVVVRVTWTRGLDKDRKEFEGLWGLVCRRLVDARGGTAGSKRAKQSAEAV